MVSFEESHAKRKNSGKKSQRPNSKRRDFKKDSGRNKYAKNKPARLKFTTVTCDSCNKRCEVPFKPNSNKPIYCEACFSKPKDKPNAKISDRDIDIINEKLNKIMKALKIE